MLSSSFYNNTLRAPQRTCTATGSRTQFQVWANAPYICISATPDFEENLIIVYVKEPSGVCHRACTGCWAALSPGPGKRWRRGGGTFDPLRVAVAPLLRGSASPGASGRSQVRLRPAGAAGKLDGKSQRGGSLPHFLRGPPPQPHCTIPAVQSPRDSHRA